MKTNLLSRYNKTVLYTYFAVLAMTVITSLWVLNKNRGEAIAERFSQIKSHEHQVELLLDSGVRAVTSLNQYATKHLSLAEAPRIDLLLSYYYYSYNSIDKVFEIIPNIQEDLQDKFKFEIGLISGTGSLERRSKQYYREMDMLFEMNLSFPVAMEMVPDAAWVYYLSANDFIGIYPWPGDDYAYSTNTQKSPIYQSALPQNNPQRSIYWTDAYADNAGKGLMTTVGTPLYIGDRFYGTLAIDITLSSLSKELLPQSDLNGHMMLMDQKNQIMAYSETLENIPAESIELVERYLPEELKSIDTDTLFNMTEGQLVNGYYVQIIQLVNAPFKLIYFEKETDLFSQSWRQFVVTIISIMLALSILLSVVHFLAKQSFIGPASRLMVHLEDCAKEPVPAPDNMSDAWLPFFSLISKAFSENKTYTQQLAEDNRQLDIQVAQRTENLRYSEERYALAMDAVEEGLWDWHINTDELHCNSAYFTMLGYQPREVLPSWKGFQRLVHPDDWKRISDKLNLHISNPTISYENEFRMLDVNGQYEWIIARGSVVEYDDDNKATRILGTHKNITKRKERERELIVAKQDAEMANRYKSEFLANMSHEIRTPMNGIMGMIQLALRTELDTQQHDYLDKAFNSANSLLLIINDILDFSRIEAGKLELEQLPFNLEDVLDAVINVNIITAQDKGLEFVLNTPTMPLRLVGDGLRLNQILTNLVSNAVKFTTEGIVELRCEVVQQNNGVVSLEFNVNDSGIGIEEDKIGNLFKAFSQADGSITREFGGSGLGLSISQHLVHMMGGEFSLKSSINKGSCFTFVIDFVLEEEIINDKWMLPNSIKGAELLLIANNELANECYQRMLPDLGFSLTQLDTIEQSLACSISPQIIVVDWVHENDEQKLTKLVDKYPSAMIFLMVNYGDDIMKLPTINQIVTGVFSKPLSPSNMMKRIQQYLKEVPKKEKVAVMPEVAKGNLLLVDDNAVNQQVAKGLLESQGYHVDLADNGQLAVDAVLNKNYDVVLMDIQMPVMDGLAATKEIRLGFTSTELPIIAMTAHAMASDKEKSVAAGMNAHITKPLALKELFDTVSECIKLKNKH